MSAKTILVIEDENVARQWVVKTLKSHGYHTIEDRTGQLALESTPSCDLAIVDYRLPYTDGLTIVEHFLEINQPFIFLTAANDMRLIKAVSETGSIFAVKGLTENELIAHVETALAMEKIRRIEGATQIMTERRGLNKQQGLGYIEARSKRTRKAVEVIAKEIIDEAEELTKSSNLFEV
ncbi:ANTAR domain-containing response regulator [Pseudomonadota bacterium]